jgi:C4-dicarboxylate-specific signal transduction histidine kinase
MDLLKSLISTDGFMPHGHCYLWDPGLVSIMVATDLLIGLAYVSISLSLYLLVKRIRLPFSAMFLAFGLFIGACGATHFMEVYTLWVPIYWAAALVKVITAIASVITAILLFPLAPKVLRMAEDIKVSEDRKLKLERSNLELENANKALEEQQKILAHSAKMSALGEMAGGIAHEINSPLAIITLHANMLERLHQRGALGPEQILTESKLIASTAKRIGEIINGLRAFAREGEKDPFEWKSLSDLLKDACLLCQTRFKSHEIDLQVSEVSPLLQIECRAVQIGQVILNLLNNAFDAVQNYPDKWVKIETVDLGESVQISVTDSGAGIPAEIIPKIMQPFFTTKEVGRGTGLGLSISKGIIESHQGSLFVDSSSSHTRLVIELPKKHST